MIEDSKRLQTTIGAFLRSSGYAVDISGDGENGMWLAATNDYDVIVLDIMLPKLDGLSLLQELRRQGNTAHVLLLSALDTVHDRVNGLQSGADDYLVKPFDAEELIARVNALCRRTYGVKFPIIAIADLEIDTTRKIVYRAGCQIKLKPREYSLLEYLAMRSGQVVSRREIEAHLYNENVNPMSNVLESTVSSLRKKISISNPTPLIHTRHGLGYVLEESPK